jgi:demethylmenaquinone methyltransferase/2-methoxy-6-polyprenyl-1,4-benzoquinol methylase
MPTVDLETTEARAAAAGGVEKRAYVRRVFSETAPRYDLLNHLLSFNIDRGGRRRAIAALDPLRDPTGVYIDLCAGTLDVASELSRTRGFRGLVLGTDFAEPMLRAGLDKAPRMLVAPVTADALELPVADEAAGAIVAFGIRNGKPFRGARGVYRVLDGGPSSSSSFHAAIAHRSRRLPPYFPRCCRRLADRERPPNGISVSA